MRRSVIILSLLCGAAIVTGVTALAWHGQPGGGTLAWTPHEDPTTLGAENAPEAPLEYFDDVLLLAQGLDYPGVRAALQAVPGGSLPGRLGVIMDQERALIGRIVAGLETASDLLGEAANRLTQDPRAHVTPQLTAADRVIGQNRTLLNEAQRVLEGLAALLGVPQMSPAAPPRRLLASAKTRVETLRTQNRALAARSHALAQGKIEAGQLLPTALRLSVPPQVFPSRPFVVSGAVLTPARLAGPRQVVVLLDGREVAAARTSGPFEIKLVASEDLPLGQHTLTALVRPTSALSGATEVRTLEVARTPLNVRVNAARWVWVPGRLLLRGDVRSAFGPAAGARVRGHLGSVEASAESGPTGSFQLNFVLPATLGAFGPQVLGVDVLPAEIWNAPAAIDAHVYVGNLMHLGFAFVVCTVLAVALRRRVTRPSGLPAGAAGDSKVDPTKRPARGGAAGRHAPAAGMLVSPELLRLYDDVLTKIEASLGAGLRPEQTLREFQASLPIFQGSPAFAAMTGLMEAALYSSRALSQDVGVEMQRLHHVVLSGMRSAHA